MVTSRRTSNDDDDRSPLKVRRPRGNTRGPRPGQGANQGEGVADVADRSNQGFARTTLAGVGSGPALSEDPGGAGVPLGGRRPQIQRPAITSEQQRQASEEFARARAASIDPATAVFEGGNVTTTGPAPTPTPPTGTQRRIQPSVVQPETPGVTVEGSANQDGGAELEQQLFDLGPVLEDVLNRISTGTFDQTRASAVIDPDTLLPTPEFRLPIFNGQEVFFGVDENQNEGFGTLVERTFTDSAGNTDTFQVFELAPGEIQNEAQAKQAAIAAARQFFIGTDEATRDTNLALLARQVDDFFATRSQQRGQQFEADQAELDRLAQERLQRIADEAQRQRDEINNAAQAHQADLDRALQAAIFETQEGIRIGDFETARRRAEQEIALNNAQFALSLLQSFSAAPEMLHALQTSGLLATFESALPGFNLSALVPNLAEGAEAESRLADIDLPSLREFQEMPADTQSQMLVSIAARTGVRREVIVAEIQRRASGQGLAGSGQVERIPA